MIRKVFTLLTVVLLSSAISYGQGQIQIPCAATEVNQEMKADFPEIEQYEAQLREYVKTAMSKMSAGRAAGKGTADPTDTLHIPVVVHVVHDYNFITSPAIDYVSDNDIFKLISHINEIFMKQNGDTVDVIPPFKKYIGNPKIMFHLAQKDPQGNVTTGITRRQSYLTYGGDDQAKFDQWDPTSYLNIWIIRNIGRGISQGVVAAYAVFPSTAAAFPYTDGIIASAGNILRDKTIPHEVGHILNLYHTWGNIQVGTACTGDDEVDDTPPTTGHYSTGGSYGSNTQGFCNLNEVLYDTSCTNNVNTLGKILIDSSLNIREDNTNGKGLTYIPRTNLTVESVKIYPTEIGESFTIENQRYNGSTYVTVNTLATKAASLANANIGSLTTTTKDTAATPTLKRTAIQFTTSKDVMLDSFKIYPSSIGDTFRILLLAYNNDTLKNYVGVTNTASGAQFVPFNTFVPRSPSNAYKLQLVRNPNLRSDSFRTSIPNYTKQVSGVIQISGTSDIDTTYTLGSMADTSYKGRYNYFYDWKIRYDALTNTKTGPQTVTLNFPVLPDTTYRLVVTKNPGLNNDSVGTAPYIKSVPCVLDIVEDVTDNRYNLLYELQIRYGYIKNCIDYPDTVNTQNIMDYSECPKMFTDLQVARMRATLESPVGGRSNLVNDTTHVRTGILSGIGGNYGLRNDLPAVPAYSVERTGLSADRNLFRCAGSIFQFKDRSWRDTVQTVTWQMSNGADINSSGSTFTQNISQVVTTPNIAVTFSEPGWADITLTANGNNTTASTETFEDAVYVADPDLKINPLNGFLMEFEQNGTGVNDLSKWPIFNYYNNDNRWEIDGNSGFYGGQCIRYNGYDNRTGTKRYTGSPKGDVDDFFTPAFDLSGMTATECRLAFMSSGAFRVADSRLYKDELEISYSIDCGSNWITLKSITKAELANMGVVSVPYAPLWAGDWVVQSIDIPVSARQSQVFFRFRFKPGVDDINASNGRILPGTGNHFYIDRINISPWKVGVNTLLGNDRKIALAPNPTNKGTQLVIGVSSREVAQIQVTDVTGKVVYTTQAQLSNGITTVDIPETAVAVKGIYMVHVQAGTETFTEKLVSY